MSRPFKLVQRASVNLAACPPAALVEPDWLGTPVASTTTGTRRYLTDLSLPVRDAARSSRSGRPPTWTSARPGPPRTAARSTISWQSSSLAPLFPVFAGRLKLTPTEITLEGFYAPPGGELGAVLDRAFLNIAARGTARWFLERAAAALATVPAVDAGDAERPRPAHPFRALSPARVSPADTR